jgi:hypothetical protein
MRESNVKSWKSIEKKNKHNLLIKLFELHKYESNGKSGQIESYNFKVIEGNFI